MLNFFRKIRKQLAEDNKPKKYLRYAVGEILLVTIGILLALQINNWNNSRIQKELEIKLLQSFIENLELDLQDLKLNYKLHRRSYHSTVIILAQLDQGIAYHDSLSFHFGNSFMTTFFVNSTGAYESLKSVGLNLISKQDLREAIFQLYEVSYKNVIIVQESIANDIETAHKTILNSRFREYWTYDFESPEIEGAIIPLDFEKLRTDQEFLYFYRSIANFNKYLNTYSLKPAIQNNQKLTEMIKKEIKVLQN